jgi:predicted flavoprotein YhiN
MYPRSLRAESVREALLGRALRAGVTIAPARRAMRVVGHRDGLLVRYDELFCGDDPRTVSTSRIILAVGHDGLGAVSGLGLASTPATPVLCPLECVSVDGVDLSAMDGRRAICKVSLESGWEATGEVLFRGYGLSGIVIMDASRRVGEGDVITLDLVDGLTDDQVRRSLDTNSDLSGVIDPTIARALGQDPALARTLRFRVTGMHEEGAQVMRGGLDVDGFEPDTLESRLVPHLHACGEALDVDADCGGFNLTWAWLSGMVAGRAAGGAGRA